MSRYRRPRLRGRVHHRLVQQRATIAVAAAVVVLLAAGSTPASLRTLAYWGVRAADRLDADELDSKTLVVDGVRIRHVARGRGEPVLLLHDFGSSLEDSWVRTGVLERLVDAGFRVLAYDARGHGRSDKPHDPGGYGEEELRDAIRVLDHVAVGRAHVVGYGRGALLAHHLRHRYPERVRSVVLGGYASDGSGEAPLEAVSATLMVAALEDGSVRPLSRAMAPPEGITGRRLALADAFTAATNDLAALSAIYRADPLPTLSPTDLRQNRVPTLVLLGARDPHVDAARRMEARMPRLQVKVLPGLGHRESAGDPAFARSVIAFLEAQRADRSEGTGPPGR